MNQTYLYATWTDSKSREYDLLYAKPIDEKLTALQEALSELSETMGSILNQLENLDLG